MLPIEVRSKNCFIANASTHPEKCRPVKFNPAAFGACYHLLSHEEFKKLQLTEPLIAGAAFPKSALPELKDFMVGNGNKKFIFCLVGISNLGPFGTPGLVSGAITDVTAAIVSASHQDGSTWLELRTNYDSGLGPAIEAHMDKVKQYLPDAPPGCSIHPSPYITAVPLTDEEEESDEFRPAVAALLATLKSFQPTTQQPAEDASIVSNVVIPTAPTLQPSPPTASPTATDKDSHEVEETLTKFRLLLSRVDKGKVVDKLRWDRSLGSSRRKVFVPAKRDAKNPGVLDENGVPFPTPHDMFVDDDCYAEVYLIIRVEQAIAASIEAIFIVLGDSDLLSRQDPISWDKLFEMIISYFNKILGLNINTRQLDIGPPDEFLQRTISKLQAFHSHRKAFTVSEMTELVGLLGYIASSCRWLRHLLSHLYTSITAALQVNQAYLVSSSRKFREAIKAARATDTFTTEEPSSDVQSFAQSWVARTVHRAQKKHYLNKTAKLELQLILAALQDPTVSKRCPIAHLVDRVEDCQAHGDSSLDAAGGFSLACRFWWYHEWGDEIRQLTLRFMRTNKNGRLISINALEFATVIINYAAITLYFRENEDPTNPFPTALVFADNTTAESSWAIKGCKNSPLGRALGRLLCAILINNPVGLSLDRVSTHANVIADKISRLKSEKDSLKFFESLASSHPQLRTCRRFIPSPELISAISEALLQGNNANPLSLNKLLLQHPGRFTI